MTIAKIHDALRAEGLVPAGEDCPLIATSFDYHNKINRALAEFEDSARYKERVEELEAEVEANEREYAELEESSERQLKEVRDEIRRLDDVCAEQARRLEKLAPEQVVRP